jgi:hypothetical protein
MTKQYGTHPRTAHDDCIHPKWISVFLTCVPEEMPSAENVVVSRQARTAAWRGPRVAELAREDHILNIRAARTPDG